MKDGGPAFPNPDSYDGGIVPKEGMTLRDYFAAAAMPLAMKRVEHYYTKEIGNDWTWSGYDFDYVAEISYEMADAMLKERER